MTGTGVSNAHATIYYVFCDFVYICIQKKFCNQLITLVQIIRDLNQNWVNVGPLSATDSTEWTEVNQHAPTSVCNKVTITNENKQITNRRVKQTLN